MTRSAGSRSGQLWALAALALLLSGAVRADNWMRSEGELYFKGAVEYERADARWDRHGDRLMQGCVGSNWKHEQSYEYGHSYYRTLFASFEYMQRRCGMEVENGLGDIALGVRSRIDLYRNGRSWEIGVILPTGNTGLGIESHTTRRYGMRLGAFTSLGKQSMVNDEPKASVELGGNIIVWQGSAPEQFSGYVKYNYVPADSNKSLFGAVEANYALIDRALIDDNSVNARELSGYDTLKVRLGFSTRASLYWRMTMEMSDVLRGRNASDSRTFSLSFSKMLMD